MASTSSSTNVRFENVWIPMSDGVRISARLWLPPESSWKSTPALLHYHPYRQSGDATLATFGYAFLIPDIRGSGNSEGRTQDEYVAKEQDDAFEIIAWLARQPWCNGRVGMFGSSWSGFSALQVAARRPPALKAVIAQCCSDDRYADDAHYLGGCIVQDMFAWGSVWTAITPLPPDPAVVGSDWRTLWKERLESLEFFVGDWIAHPHRDAFWKHGSVCEEFDQIECPVYAIGGWTDSYHSAVPRLLAGLKSPRKALIGPWGHSKFNRPGPAIDWLQESLRWWDFWLKDIDTGVMAEPRYRVWMQYETATTGVENIAGRWVAEEVWPSPRIRPRVLYLTKHGLTASPAESALHSLRSPQSVGITAPHLCPFDMDTDPPVDQRLDDARSLTFDSAPLMEALEILGAPAVTLDLSVDKPVAFLAIRLNELAPTGESRRVTYAILNLTHRDSHESPSPLEPNRVYRLCIQMRDHAYRFKPGHRIRVAISTTYWPLIWPSPEEVVLTIHSGSSELELPLRDPRPEDAELTPFGGGNDFAARGEMVSQANASNSGNTKLIEWDVKRKVMTIRSHSPSIVGTYGAIEVSTIQDDDPTSACLEYRRNSGIKRDNLDVKVETALRMNVTREEFHLIGEVHAFECNQEVFRRIWKRSIPRRLV